MPPGDLERLQYIKLLKETLVVFEAGLPASKDLADAKIVQRWSGSKVLKQEMNRLRDFYDEFCIEISLICVPLELQELRLSDSGDLCVIVEPLMGLLESLVTASLRPRKPSRFAYPCLRALRSELKESRKRGETIGALDRRNDGLLEFKVDPWDHEGCLQILRRCRKKVAGLVDFDSCSVSNSQVADWGKRHLEGSIHPAVLVGRVEKLETNIFTDFRQCSGTTHQSRTVHLALLPLTSTAGLKNMMFLSSHEQGFVHVDLKEIMGRSIYFKQKHLENEDELATQTTAAGLCDLLSKHPVHRVCVARKNYYASSHRRWTAREGRRRIANLDFMPVKSLIERSYRYELFLSILPSADAELNVDYENPFLGVYPGETGPEGFAALQLEKFGDCFHSHPSILELGILLLEIQYGQTIKDMCIQQNAGELSGKGGWDNDLITAWSIIDDPNFDKDVGKGTATAIRSCLRCDFFPVDLPLDSDMLLQLAFRHILRPLELEKLLSDDGIPELPDLEDEELDSPNAETKTTARVHFMSLPTDGSQKWRVFDEQPFSEEQIRSADDWVQQLTEFLDRIMSPLLEGERHKSLDDKRTKVAILDTGIDLRNGYIRSQADRIKEKQNWVPGGEGSVNLEDVADSFGHGTHVAGLLLKTAPCADICIGRVASGKLLENGETYVAEAIIWASETCKADIITMSFGFLRSSDIVEEAIIRAHAKGTIMFAATRNDGGNKAIAYPANHHNVIGIASSDGLGNGSKFNPNAPEDDASFFSTLGEAVESSWPRLPYTDENGNSAVTGSKRRKSGTSFATPIAAGLAANILDYARLELDMGDKYLKRLRTFAKMVAVLKLMAPEKRTGYRYLVPWLQWWTCDEYSTQEELEVEKTRIRTDILKVLMR